MGTWTGGAVQTTRAHGGLQSYGVASSTAVDLAFTWESDQVFEAGVRYVMHIWASQAGESPTQTLSFGVAGVDEEVTSAPILLQSNQPGSVGAALWYQYRICWTPSGDRTGVRFRWQETQSPAGYFVLDDLELFTAANEYGGTSPKAMRCDREYHAHEIVLHGTPAGLSATDVQTGFEEHGSDTDAHHLEDHAARHASGGGDAVKLDDLATPDDNTDLNVSTTRHGLTPKLPNDATKYLDGTGAWTAPAGGGGGGALTQAYVGKNGVGATVETMSTRRMYATKVTLANDCLITDIEAHVIGNTSGQVTAFNVLLLDDNAGSPGKILSFSAVMSADNLFVSVPVTPVARWLGCPIGRWVPAGDYWLAVQQIDSGADLDIYKDTSGGTCATWTAGGSWIQDGAGSTITTTTHDYSIRANTIR